MPRPGWRYARWKTVNRHVDHRNSHLFQRYFFASDQQAASRQHLGHLSHGSHGSQESKTSEVLKIVSPQTPTTSSRISLRRPAGTGSGTVNRKHCAALGRQDLRDTGSGGPPDQERWKKR
ncbi:hypothetical protein V5799_026192 [Amblyomma americanum]|uniref:Uncharacterized protein n=1 Tax=Amblyomma americanum TaxID=6943 RepID=A0AAQ4DJA1_AMBAM